MLIIPDKDDPNSLLVDNKQKTLNQIANYRGNNIFTVASVYAFPMMDRLYENNTIFLISRETFSNLVCSAIEIEKAIFNHRINTLKADDKIMKIVRMHLYRGRSHPVLNVLKWCKARRHYCKSLMIEIIDPRLMLTPGMRPFSQSHINKIFAFCELYYRSFIQDSSLKDITNKAKLALNCWYSPILYRKFNKYAGKHVLHPNTNLDNPLLEPSNYFWRYFINNSFVTMDIKSLVKTTKRFLNFMIRLWGSYLTDYQFVPNRFFKYICEAADFNNYLTETNLHRHFRI